MNISASVLLPLKSLCILFSIANYSLGASPQISFVHSSLSKCRGGKSPCTIYKRRSDNTAWTRRDVDLFAGSPSSPGHSSLSHSPASIPGKKNKNGKSTRTNLSAATMELADNIAFNRNDYQIFCDMDGVLADFEAGVQNIMNLPTKQLPKHIMWRGIRRADNFFEHLPWTKGGRQLWNAIRHLSPDILTGVPDHESSKLEKFNWCRRELGLKQVHHVDMAAGLYRHTSVNGNSRKEGVCNVITCWSFNKHYESHPRAVLIDDRIDLKDTWEASGGIFVHHTDVESTLRQLREHAVI